MQVTRLLVRGNIECKKYVLSSCRTLDVVEWLRRYRKTENGIIPKIFMIIIPFCKGDSCNLSEFEFLLFEDVFISATS